MKSSAVSNVSILINMQKQPSHQINSINQKAVKCPIKPIKSDRQKSEKCTLTQFEALLKRVVSFFANNRTNSFHLFVAERANFEKKRDPFRLKLWLLIFGHMTVTVRRDHPFNDTDYLRQTNWSFTCFSQSFVRKWTHEKKVTRRIKRIWSSDRIQQKKN